MAMSRKDYELIASTVKGLRRDLEVTTTSRAFDAFATLDALSRRLADRLGSANSSFDRDRFLEATGVYIKGTT